MFIAKTDGDSKTLGSSRVEQDGAPQKKLGLGRILGETGVGIPGAQLGWQRAMEGSRIAVVVPQDGE